MITVEDRIVVERRLLAALFLWPRPVDLTPEHFMMPEHGAIYDVICDAALFYAPAVLPVVTDVYDPAFLEVIVQFAQDYAHEKYRGRYADPGGWAQHLRTYILAILVRQPVARTDIPDLVKRVRLCPRCGR